MRRSSTSPGWCWSSAGSRTASTPTALTPTGSLARSAHDESSADVCRDHITPDRAGYGGYAERFLAEPPGSKERQALATAIGDGEVPLLIRLAGRNPEPIKVDKADAPAVDIQQEGGAFGRLTFAALLFAGALGAVALLGFLSLAVILAQVVALVLLGFAPVALIIGIFPGAGHAFFRGWLSKLATAVFIKALYSLVIAIVVAVSAALTAATGSLGFLFAFGLQTIFFWAIFINRKQIAGRLVAATTGAADAPAPPMPRRRTIEQGAHAATKPFSAMAGVTRSGTGKLQQRVLVLAGSQADDAASSQANATRTRRPPDEGAGPTGETPTPTEPGPDRGGAHELPSVEPETTPGESSSRVSPAASEPSADGSLSLVAGAAGDPAAESTATDTEHASVTPRASHEDVMRRARELRDRQRNDGHGPEQGHA